MKIYCCYLCSSIISITENLGQTIIALLTLRTHCLCVSGHHRVVIRVGRCSRIGHHIECTGRAEQVACIRLEDTLLDLWHSHAWCVTHHLSVVHHGSPDVSLIVRLVLSSRINPHLKVLAHLEIVSHWDLLRVATMCLEGLVLLTKACLV